MNSIGKRGRQAAMMVALLSGIGTAMAGGGGTDDFWSEIQKTDGNGSYQSSATGSPANVTQSQASAEADASWQQFISQIERTDGYQPYYQAPLVTVGATVGAPSDRDRERFVSALQRTDGVQFYFENQSETPLASYQMAHRAAADGTY